MEHARGGGFEPGGGRQCRPRWNGDGDGRPGVGASFAAQRADAERARNDAEHRAAAAVLEQQPEREHEHARSQDLRAHMLC